MHTAETRSRLAAAATSLIAIALAVGGTILASPAGPPAPAAAQAPEVQAAAANDFSRPAVCVPAGPTNPSPKSKGTDVSVSTSPTHQVTSSSTPAPEAIAKATVTHNGKNAKGSVRFTVDGKKLGTAKLKGGFASLDIPDEMVGFGAHTVKGVYLPKGTKGAKKKAGTTVIRIHHMAHATYTINGKESDGQETIVIKPKSKVTAKATFTDDDGAKLNGKAVVSVPVKSGKSGDITMKDFKVKVKNGKAVVKWTNQLARGTATNISWDVSLRGNKWGEIETLPISSGKAKKGSSDQPKSEPSSSPTSTSRYTLPPTQPRQCGYKCVQYGYGTNFAGTFTYGCLQQIYTCQ
jgi:hypothetical protein